MDIKNLNPWKWFNKDKEEAGKIIPVQRSATRERDDAFNGAIDHFHREIDRFFDQMFQSVGLMPVGPEQSMPRRKIGSRLKPTLDLAATENEYSLTMEAPGVDEKDVKLEIVNDTLTIQGEEKQENEEKSKDCYRMERSYGSFKRVLSLPVDADQNSVSATFNKGVLTVTMPRKELPKANIRQIAVKNA